MSEDGDDDSKTEDASQHKLDEAAKKGQIVYSREVNNFLLLAAFAVLVISLSPSIMRHMRDVYAPFLTRPESFLTDSASLGNLLMHAMGDGMMLLAGPFAAIMGIALLAGFSQTRFNISAQPLIPKFEKISIRKGWSKMVSRRSLMEFLKGILKISLVGTIAYMAVRPKLEVVRQLPDTDIETMLNILSSLASRMLIGILVALFFIALFDYLYQRFEFMKQMRMSKQELKEEYKQQEGDPHIKQRLRALRMERARTRMMAAVPTADVVITNPTHFAVALTYNATDMKAPVVVAKGADVIAARIREVAKENDVPIVENPPLARALYDNVDIDREIPFDHYKAVAEVIGYVYKLKGKQPVGK